MDQCAGKGLAQRLLHLPCESIYISILFNIILGSFLNSCLLLSLNNLMKGNLVYEVCHNGYYLE